MCTDVSGYESKPTITIVTNGSKKEVHLSGGHYGAREDIEQYLGVFARIDFVQNIPTGKIIGLKRR